MISNITAGTALQCFLDSARGVYIPKNFAQCIAADQWDYANTSELVSDLLFGPDSERYWEVWQDILDNIKTKPDSNGNVYQLHQGESGDLFLVCWDLLTDAQYEEFTGEPREI